MKLPILLKKVLVFVVAVFVAMNFIAYMHASRFTHFGNSTLQKIKDADRLSFGQKLKALFTGVNNPRPENSIKPVHAFKTIYLQSNKRIECWYINAPRPKGTVILCHGYNGNKSSMLDKADVFMKLGYSTFLIDFMGSGGSEGNQTTIGFYEAQQVQSAVEYLYTAGEKNIVLFGTSMGAVAIMKALNDQRLNASAIILECPFGTMLETVEARFKTMGVPAFPMARLLMFWGGFQNKFDAFAHNPAGYAKAIPCPTLLLYGARDEKVSRSEINTLFKNLKGKKVLRIYPLAGHENYLKKYSAEWTNDVLQFLESVER